MVLGAREEMRIFRKGCLVLLVITLMGCVALAEGDYTRDDVLPFMQNEPAPVFTLPTTAGDLVSLSDYAGKPVLVLVWESSSEECLSTLAQLPYAKRTYPDVVILTVNSVLSERNQALWSTGALLEHENWIQGYFYENAYPFPALIDCTGEVVYQLQYASTTLPIAHFIDREGILRISWQGRLSRQTVDTLLSMMIALDS